MHSIIEYLYNAFPFYERQGKSGYKPGMSNTLALDEFFNHPHRHYKTIHVAGTNGKGSTSHMLASILQEQGYKIGLYTSPHLIEFNERIRVNGVVVNDDAVVAFIEQNKAFIESLSPSFFEVTTAFALWYFAQQKVDIAVIEVGLGGRLDCTNVINPLVSVITNISFDHKDLLGYTLPEIAREKAGIIKDSTTVVIGQTQAEIKDIFIETAQQKQAPIYFADKCVELQKTEIDGQPTFTILKPLVCEKIQPDLHGLYQEKNIKTVIQTIDILKTKIDISDNSIKNGIEHVIQNTGFMGRWQKLSSNPDVYCDVAHNEDGISLVMEQIKHTTYKTLHIVWGMVNDKDIESVMKYLPKHARYYLTQPSIERAMSVEILRNQFQKYDLSFEIFPEVKKALENAKKNAMPNDLIFIGGSTFVVSDALKK